MGTRVFVTGASQTNFNTWEYAVLRYEQSTGSLVSSTVTSSGGTNIELVSAATLDAYGNIYLTGALGVSGQGFNIKTIKLSSSLAILWTANWNGAANLDDAGRSVAVDTAGNVFVAGYTTGSDRNGILLKYSAAGSLVFAQSDTTSGADEYTGIALSSAQEPFVGGYKTIMGSRDFQALFFANNGTLLWSDTYNGYANAHDEVQQVVPDGFGNYLLSGTSGESTLAVKYNRHSLLMPQDEEVNAPFIENRGQVMGTDSTAQDDVRFYTRSNYPNTYIFDDQVSFVFAHIDTVAATQDTMARLDMRFVTENATLAVGLEQQEAFHNYYLGHIPEGRERVPLHNKVLQPDIYTNIDALYGLGQDGFFARFVCKPGSNPGLIRLLFRGHTDLTVETDGSLRIESDLEDLVLAPPTAVLVDAGGTESNASWEPEFYVLNDSTVRIIVGAVPSGNSLILGTGRTRGYGEYVNNYWSTYYGDTGDDEVISLDTDINGDIYFTGTTTSSFFPIQNAIQDQLFLLRDAFAGRFNYQGVVYWVTYYGGNKAADSPFGGFSPTIAEYGLDIVVGANINQPESDGGTIFFVGRTDALDFPLLQKPGAFFDDKFYFSPNNWSYRGFVVELTKNGGFLEWSTFFGDAGTGSASFPSPQEGVTIARINPEGNLVIGGPIERTDFPNFVSSFPTTASGVQYSQSSGTGFIAEFDPSGALVWATELACGGSSSQLGVHDIAFSSNGDIYIVGQSNFANLCDDPFPLLTPTGGYLKNVPTGEVDGWIMKFDSDRSLVWSTFFGGNASDQIKSALVDINNNLIVVGSTNSSDLPIQSLGIGEYFDGSHNGGRDIFISRFSDNCTLQYSTYFGGEADEFYSPSTDSGPHDGGCAAFLGESLVITGPTKSADFPVFNSIPGNTYYYPNINKGFNATFQDAFLLVLNENLTRTFCTYWGGEKDDRAREIATASVNDQNFAVIGGVTKTNVNIQDRKIPLSKEVPDSYFQNSHGGGGNDGFVSKIRLDGLLSNEKNLAAESEFTIFPNPTSESVIIRMNSGTQWKKLGIKLFDITGRSYAIQPIQINEESWQINMSSLPTGNYILTIFSENCVNTQLVIKF
ncbi:MAG TPA: SBBP repeat-containing protein [Saprospiraceae bacterium]|nr:SBBP repeat-containing protein [Saprospiraceae bacterium]